MLELAESLTKGSGDGRISKDDATKLWEDAMDGQGVTDCERRTIQYVYDTFNCTDAAKTEFASLLGIEDATAMEVDTTDTAAEAAAAAAKEEAAAAAKADAEAAAKAKADAEAAAKAKADAEAAAKTKAAADKAAADAAALAAAKAKAQAEAEAAAKAKAADDQSEVQAPTEAAEPTEAGGGTAGRTLVGLCLMRVVQIRKRTGSRRRRRRRRRERTKMRRRRHLWPQRRRCTALSMWLVIRMLW